MSRPFAIGDRCGHGRSHDRSQLVDRRVRWQVSECYEGRVPPRDVLLAQLVVDRCTELPDLIGWYRRSCVRVLTNQPLLAEDEAEQEPF